MSRYLLMALGGSSLALGIIGIVVPGWPATEFLLGATYCFSKSSPRFSAWLKARPWLGPRLDEFTTRGGMPLSAKRRTLYAMWAGAGVSAMVLAGEHPTMAALTLVMCTLGTLSVWFGVRTVPERPPARVAIRGLA